jgi:hypothetical protein
MRIQVNRSPSKGNTKSLKKLQVNKTKQVKELNKTIQDLKTEIETIIQLHKNPYSMHSLISGY